MTDFRIEKYNSTNALIWNNFVEENQYCSFLFHRNFMEYHSDRFKDFSFLIFENNMLIAICPANNKDSVVYSHQGLTYGGILFRDNYNDIKIEGVFSAILSFLKQNKMCSLDVKVLPCFYGDNHAEVKQKLFGDYKGKAYRTDKVLAIDYSKSLTIHKTKLKKYRKNQVKGFEIIESNDFSSFWNKVLIPRLQEKHNAKPVHSLDEIKLLKLRFPNNIRQFNILLGDKLLAGITIFDKGNVVKSQYGATTKIGEKERALEYLFLHLIYKYKEEEKLFFSMGTVTENNELGYNEGLLKQKEELGCSIYLQNFYNLVV